MKIEIFDPAMCCSTGVCGPSVDPELVRIKEVLRRIQKQAPEVKVERYGLSNDPQAFVANSAVAELLKSDGPGCLPLSFVDGKLLSKGSYPGNEQLQTILKNAGLDLSLLGEKNKTASCGCRPGCC
ncbi:MAG: arsenite efflux transporter metallochaperone ArsD [Desulfuromonadaceae bacterium]|nr:arsenite efflux transporter metallochaperone ArsD [Desulfuromonadaceae bacterium]